MSDEPIRAGGYIRVSQERNARGGYGLDAQETEMRRYAEYKRIELVTLYRETGASGYESRRPALQRLLADAKAGKFDLVIFPAIDRAARSVKDVIEIDGKLRKCGCDLVFLREGIDTSTPTGELFRNIIASVAQWEGRIIYERMSKGKRSKAAKGGYIGGYLPYGYRSEDGKVMVVGDQAAIVQRIFETRARGLSYRAMIEELAADRVPTAGGRRWQVSTLRGMIANRFYTGRVAFDGQLIRAQHDAIISDLLFQQANQHGRAMDAAG